jgi:hypothetical protein
LKGWGVLVEGLGCSSGFRVRGSGFRVQGSGFRVYQGPEYNVHLRKSAPLQFRTAFGFGVLVLRVWGLGFRVEVSGLRAR